MVNSNAQPSDGAPQSNGFPHRRCDEFRPFPLESLPPLIHTFIEEASVAMGCDPTYVALPLLSALGSAIGNTRRIRLKNGWCEPPILWMLTVGESGSMKTPGFKCALKLLREIQEDALRRYAEEMAVWKIEKSAYDAALKNRKSDCAEGSLPREGCEPPQQPTADRYLVMDTTVEALAPILSENPRGVLLARDEMSGWFGSFERYAKGGAGGADAAHWLVTWSGENMQIDRKTGDKRFINVPSACVSVTGGIQPAVLRRVLGQKHRESGMAARFLFAFPPRRLKVWTEAEPNPCTERRIRNLFKALLALKPVNSPRGDWTPVELGLNNESLALWKDFYNAHAQEQSELEGDVAAAWSKLEAYPARFALIDHIVRTESGAIDVADSNTIGVVSMRAGIALAQWFGEEALRIYNELDETDSERDQRGVLRWIERQAGAVTASALSKGLRHLRGDSAAASAALQALAVEGLGVWIDVRPSKNGGRRTQRFLLHRTATETTDALAVIGGFGDGDSRERSPREQHRHGCANGTSLSEHDLHETTTGLDSDNRIAIERDQQIGRLEWDDPLPDCKGTGDLGGVTLMSDQATTRNGVGNSRALSGVHQSQDQGGRPTDGKMEK